MDETSLLYEISQVLTEHLDLKKSLSTILKKIATFMNMQRVMLSLLDSESKEIKIEIFYGLSKKEAAKGKYKVGEGVTGQVIERGQAIVIPQISKEAAFLNKTRFLKDQKEHSFFCVPIKDKNNIIGALSADKIFVENYNLKKDEKILSIIASLIAKHVNQLEIINREKHKLKEENKRLKDALQIKYSFGNMVGNSNKMREVYQMITQVSGTNANILIRGESGTGKELVSNSIHYNSKRSKQPFIKINCAAIPVNLIESEFFGHEKGSFTGALNTKIGKFELANKGTIFLDEIGSINLETQAKLLRVLQEREFERVGGNRIIKVDLRIIAASNKNLEKSVEEESFRNDLYYRLNVFPIYLPPLRERKTDVILLADHFLEKYSMQNNKNIKRISSGAIDMLMTYHWPGNVRELENCIERATILCNEEVLRTYHFPPSLQTGKASNTLSEKSLDEAICHLEKEMITDALKNTYGNIKGAAKLLKTTTRKLAYKAKKLSIDYKQYKL